MNRRFDCEMGPFARCLPLRRRGMKSTLILTFDHSIADGRSGMIAIRKYPGVCAHSNLGVIDIESTIGSARISNMEFSSSETISDVLALLIASYDSIMSLNLAAMLPRYSRAHLERIAKDLKAVLLNPGK